jgi:hypothetical protein
MSKVKHEQQLDACGCKQCKHKRVIDGFAQSDCHLLSEVSLTKPMTYRCECGNTSSIRWFNFKNGERCRGCAVKKIKANNPKRLNVSNTVHEFFINSNCKLLDVYTNQDTPMRYICECGNEAVIKWKVFKKGCRCHDCAKIKIKNRTIPSGAAHSRWNPDRDQVELNKTVRNRAKKILKRTLLHRMKSETTFKLLGYTKDEMINHITTHPNWSSVRLTPDWELDHIFPISAFFQYGIYDINIINRLDNLRPLEKQKNREKNNKYNEKDFEKWLEDKAIPFFNHSSTMLDPFDDLGG